MKYTLQLALKEDSLIYPYISLTDEICHAESDPAMSKWDLMTHASAHPFRKLIDKVG